MSELRKLAVHSSSPYVIYIGEDILEECSGALNSLGPDRIIALCDGRVRELWRERLDGFFRGLDAPVAEFIVENAENDKNMDSVVSAVRMMAREGFGPESCVMSVGGGAVTDLAGFVSDIYMRGVRLVHVPTSIISMTDSCAGGKTALDLDGVKNLIGTFRQPDAVIADSSFLSTMSEDQINDGYGEIIKYDMISGRNISLIPDMSELIYECLRVKTDIVRQDESDRGIRHLLNFGHTFGHAYEALSGYAMSHGRAVGYGMKTVCAWAAAEGIAPPELYRELVSKLEARGITGMPGYRSGEVCDLVRYDKKRSGEGVDLVVPVSFGELKVMRIPLKDLEPLEREAIEWM